MITSHPTIKTIYLLFLLILLRPNRMNTAEENGSRYFPKNFPKRIISGHPELINKISGFSKATVLWKFRQRLSKGQYIGEF